MKKTMTLSLIVLTMGLFLASCASSSRQSGCPTNVAGYKSYKVRM